MKPHKITIKTKLTINPRAINAKNLPSRNCFFEAPSIATKDFDNATKKETNNDNQKTGRTLGKSPKFDAETMFDIKLRKTAKLRLNIFFTNTPAFAHNYPHNAQVRCFYLGFEATSSVLLEYCTTFFTI